MPYMDEYKRWLRLAKADPALQDELRKMDAVQIEDSFYRDLTFGTGGLRGIIGAGTNRMNIYTVTKASQGLADYIKKHHTSGSVAISYDSRINSVIFAKAAAEVFAANGIKTYIYSELMPTPCLSFAVRELHCSAGIMITASHNAYQYNGYKAYDSSGCQITTNDARRISAEIKKLDIFTDIKRSKFEKCVEQGNIEYIDENVYTAFIEKVKAESVLYGEKINKNVSIVYSPLNGTGLRPVLRILKECGYTNIMVVKEQKEPDGRFPTCRYPNPENQDTMLLGISYARKYDADLFLATDPDCDRIGVAVKNSAGEYILLSGNETGILLLDYICAQKTKHCTMPEDGVMVKTIVTTDMGEQIASHYGIKTINVLTGFKFIGEQIGLLEKTGREGSYIFGFEESYGYLSGTYVRDKDAVNAAFLVCEMFAYYTAQGISLPDKLAELYSQYGYTLNTLHAYVFEGSAGTIQMRVVMAAFRKGIRKIGKKEVIKIIDYSEGVDDLPSADVIKYVLEDGSSVTVRPSGTEPKLKIYISIRAEDQSTAAETESELMKDLKQFLTGCS